MWDGIVGTLQEFVPFILWIWVPLFRVIYTFIGLLKKHTL